MILVVLLWATSFAASILGVEMTLNPPQNDKTKRRYRIAFFCLGVLGVGLAIPQYLEQQKRETTASQTLGEIKSNTEKASFQLFFESFVETRMEDRVETNLLNGIPTIIHIPQATITPSVEGLSPGKIIKLKKSKDVLLSVIVYGNSSADHLTIELLTPWVEKANITGDVGWQDYPAMQYLDSETKTFSLAHKMILETPRLIPAREFVPLPHLHIPTNYPGESIPIRFSIYSNNAKSQDVGVVFKLE